MVVGVDGSAGSRAAIRWAVREALLVPSRIDAVVAWQSSAVRGTAATHAAVPSRTIDDERDAVAADVEAAVRQEVGGADHVAVELHVVHGTPARVLTQLARDADLLVIGGQSRGHIQSRLPWSTGQRILRDCACPVVVVPAG